MNLKKSPIVFPIWGMTKQFLLLILTAIGETMNNKLKLAQREWIKSQLRFILLVFGISVFFWAVGPLAEKLLNKSIPVDLPLSSLMVISPITASLICVYKQEGSSGIAALIKRVVDFQRIEKKKWYVVIILLMPSILLMEYLILNMMGGDLPKLNRPDFSLLVFIPIFFIAAVFEEIGWQGYVYDRLRIRLNALNASMLLGGIWALWHIIPLIQLQDSPTWIAWQTLNIFLTRILLVWIYENTGKSVFGSIIFHMMVNVSTVLMPKFGIPYDPAIFTLIIAALVILIGIIWDPDNLSDHTCHTWRKNIVKNQSS